jgi:cyclic-di-AMP phosphodiesterase PgpH
VTFFDRVRQTLEGDPPETPGKRAAYHGFRVALFLLVAAFTYVLFPATPAVEHPIFEIGSVATETVIAPFAFDVPKSDAELAREQEELARSVRPVFVHEPAWADSAIARLSAFSAALDSAIAGNSRQPEAERIREAAAGRGLTLTAPESEYLATPGRRRAMVEGVQRAYHQWLRPGAAASGATEEVRGDVILRQAAGERSLPADSLPGFSTFLARARATHPDPNASAADNLYLKLLTSFYHPTIIHDRVSTERRRQELRATVDPVRYRVMEAEKIVGEHEVVGRAEFEKLRALQEAIQQQARGERALTRVLGAILYNALVLGIFVIAVVLFRPQLYRSVRSLSLFAFVFMAVVVGAFAVTQMTSVAPELVPVAFAAIILSVLFDPRISMIAAMILAVLVGGQSVFRGTNALFIHLIGGAAAALSVRVIRRRDQSYYSILMIGVAYAFAAFAIGMTLGWTAGAIGTSALWGFVNALVSVSLAMSLLPLAERYTGVTTDLTLLEYSDLNRPLLRRLSLEAPGTYAHTVVMANLVEAACNAIGANGLLARVGTYYHDIGKIRKPQYFVENQARGRNPHDKLKPNTSASIIRNHVREGVELAAEHKLPKVLTAFIAEHHGTGQIAYFAEKARDRDGQLPTTGEFAYPGPVPQSAETAVCMLADGVEAAVRVISDPTPDKIRDVVDHIVRQRVEQGQLRDAPLTLRQLEQVKEQFARVLIGMHHNRIDYPVSSGGITSEFAKV